MLTGLFRLLGNDSCTSAFQLTNIFVVRVMMFFLFQQTFNFFFAAVRIALCLDSCMCIIFAEMPLILFYCYSTCNDVL